MVQIVAPSNGRPGGRGAQRRSSGVTLLEILVAVGVMAFAISAIMQIFPVGFADSARASYLAVAYELAGQKMEEIRGNYMFGGDPNPDVESANASGEAYEETYKFFGHRTHPVKAVDSPEDTDKSKFSESTMLGNGSSTVYVPFDNDGVKVESRYFYSVDIVPMTDITQRFNNLPKVYSESKDAAATEADWNDNENRYNFPDCYRVTVKVRGPLQEVEQALDDNWGNYKKGAVEATLATVISNKDFGIAYLAYDLLCRYSTDGSTEEVWHSGRDLSSPYAVSTAPKSKQDFLDSRSIYVTGVGDGTTYTTTNGVTLPNTKRFYPESFAVLDPTRLSPNELWDTGPAIVVKDGVKEYYMMRHNSLTWSKLQHPNDTYLPENTVGWNDVRWSSANKYVWQTDKIRYNDNTAVKSCYQGEGSAYEYIPGGLNLLGQDNIMIMCKKDATYTGGDGVYVESNKLIFMVPPHSKDVVTLYGEDQVTENAGNYWRFDLLNQVYARDSDCSNRKTVYGSQPLASNKFDSDYFNASSGSGTLIVGDSLGTPVSVNTSGMINKCCYYYPKATFNNNGTLKSGTVVRFLMTMPQTN